MSIHYQTSDFFSRRFQVAEGESRRELEDSHDCHPQSGRQQRGGELEYAALRQAGPYDHQCGQGQRRHQRQTHQRSVPFPATPALPTSPSVSHNPHHHPPPAHINHRSRFFSIKFCPALSSGYIYAPSFTWGLKLSCRCYSNEIAFAVHAECHQMALL